MSDAPIKKEIIYVLADDSSLKIMKLLDRNESSARLISTSLNMPLSTTYRKIKRLEQLKIIKTTKVVRTLDGLDEFFYTLSIKEIKVTYKNNALSFTLKQKEMDEKIVRLWQKFKD